LAGHARDRVEVTIVVEEGRAVHFGDRCDEEVDWRGPAVLPSARERGLSPERYPFDPSIDRKAGQQGKITSETIALVAAPCREQELQRDRRADGESACIE
jgi:hypothetical protein